ncbi:hypothetical protein BDW66DRAFT_69597 [Aspergillus desertorum]
MDIANTLQTHPSAIKCIDMHTTGEPTRIIYWGFPQLRGATLLDKRDDAQSRYNHLRKRLMLEPRGHSGMYGAILVHDTELVRSGDAHIGVLFTHAGGFSTMCGHATIALGRFLVDTDDRTVFPKKGELVVDPVKTEVEVRIHAPCGVVTVSVPVARDEQGRVRSDGNRRVSFLSTPGYVAGLAIEVDIPGELRWRELGEQMSIVVDICYGGAFYALVETREMGFERGLGGNDAEMKALAAAARKLKRYLSAHPAVVKALQRSEDERLSFLYGVMVVDSNVGFWPDGCEGAETGLCFFGDSDTVDRSPTGSCVTARMALAHAKGARGIAQRWAYNSLVSNQFATGAFVGTIIDQNVMVTGYEGDNWPAVIVRVEGSAYYMGAMAFMHEDRDITSKAGFMMDV